MPTDKPAPMRDFLVIEDIELVDDACTFCATSPDSAARRYIESNITVDRRIRLIVIPKAAVFFGEYNVVMETKPKIEEI